MDIDGKAGESDCYTTSDGKAADIAAGCQDTGGITRYSGIAGPVDS